MTRNIARAAVALAVGGGGMIALLPARPVLAHLWLLAALLYVGFLAGQVLDYTLRKADERQRRFRSLLGIAADAYWELDARGCLVRFSAKEELRAFVGLNAGKPDSGLGRLFWETRGVRLEPRARQAFQGDLAARRPMRDVPLGWSDAAGHVRFFLLNAEPRHDKRGHFAGYWGVLREVTREMKARRALRSTETRYRDLFRRTPTALVLHREGRVLDANPAAVALFGHADLAGMAGRALADSFQAGSSRELALDRIRQLDALPAGDSLGEAEFTLEPQPGRLLTVRVSSVRIDMGDRGDMNDMGRRAATLSIVCDDTERRRAEDRVRRSEALYEAILENALIGIAFTRDRRFLLTNSRFDEMFDWARGALQGRPSYVVWPSSAAYAEIGRTIEPALARGEQVDIECEMMRRDGSCFVGRLLAKALDPSQPGAGGTIWLAEDVSQRRQVEQALARARDEAEAANRAKSAFLANTSHEIRTPLNALTGLARLACAPDLEEARRQRYLEQICDSADTLSAILSDILDLSKIEAGKLIVEHVVFDLHALLEAVTEAYQPLTDAKRLVVRLNIEPDVPRYALGDPLRLRQVLGNYLANAVKFTPSGRIDLNAQKTAGHRLRFEVVDTGAGVDANDLSMLFQPFSQVDNSITRKVGGTGLGLSICSELARLMDGEVGVLSRAGQGSIFWVEIPLPAASGAQALSHTRQQGLDALQGARALLVEDNPVNMMIAAALLERWGAVVEQAGDGPAALRAVQAAADAGHPFDVVLMDVQMPGMSGHEVTRRLRQTYGPAQLPIVALTAAALVSERTDALAAGMNDFLTKPIDATRLRMTLQRLLAESRE